MTADQVRALAIAAQEAHVQTAGAAEAADRGWIEVAEADRLFGASRRAEADLAAALTALPPDERAKLLAALRAALTAKSQGSVARAREWVEGGMVATAMDAPWAISWLLR
jgi:hypothetical protein